MKKKILLYFPFADGEKNAALGYQYATIHICF